MKAADWLEALRWEQIALRQDMCNSVMMMMMVWKYLPEENRKSTVEEEAKPLDADGAASAAAWSFGLVVQQEKEGTSEDSASLHRNF